MRGVIMSKMKKCKVCGENIAKSAKTCPHCGAKNKPGAFRVFLGQYRTKRNKVA